MYCIDCGSDNIDTAKFCRKCGRSFEVEEETRVASRREDGTISKSAASDREASGPVVFTISPTLMFVKAGYVLAAVGALLLAALTSIFLSAWISVWFSVILGLLLFLIPAYFHFKQRMVRYTLTETNLEIDEGFISRTTRSVPIRRIQDVTVSSTVPQRLLGLGSLMIDNASDDAGKIVLGNINDPRRHADMLLKQMRRLED